MIKSTTANKKASKQASEQSHDVIGRLLVHILSTSWNISFCDSVNSLFDRNHPTTKAAKKLSRPQIAAAAVGNVITPLGLIRAAAPVARARPVKVALAAMAS